jgi:hypothetical protein
MVITATQLLKGQNLQGDHGANTTLWLRDVDALQETGEEARWDLHSLLRRAQSLSWKSHPTISQIYGKLPRVSPLVKYRRVQFAGHGFRADAEVIFSLLLWRPSYGQSRGRKLSFPDVISRDTGLSTEDLKAAMRDRGVWCDVVQSMIATAVD